MKETKECTSNKKRQIICIEIIWTGRNAGKKSKSSVGVKIGAYKAIIQEGHNVLRMYT
jgi:hypothetical protein